MTTKRFEVRAFPYLMVFGIVSVALGGVYVAYSNTIRRQAAVKQGGAGLVSCTTTNPGGDTLTIRHDGHLFVTYGRSGIVHHPSCPCLGGTVKVEGQGKAQP